MKVCERCLRAIESKEGKQATIEIGGSDEAEYLCDFCGDSADRLFQILSEGAEK